MRTFYEGNFNSSSALYCLIRVEYLVCNGVMDLGVADVAVFPSLSEASLSCSVEDDSPCMSFAQVRTAVSRYVDAVRYVLEGGSHMSTRSVLPVYRC